MNQNRQTEYHKPLYYRLIALWVVCEAFAGGIMHGIKIPFSGLIVSSLAITCIILIAYHVPSGSSIIKATVIVAIFKLLLSPHSPPTAYIAVFFQGMLGQLLFTNRRYFNIAAVVLAVLALIESAIQRILVLVIIYGNQFWNAVNIYIQKLTHEKVLTNYSLLIALMYIFLHALTGLFVGIYAARLAKKSSGWKSMYPSLVFDQENYPREITAVNTRKAKKMKWVFLAAWLALLAMFIQSYVSPQRAIVPTNIIVNILLRSLLILLSWYLVISPLCMYWIKRSLLSREGRYKKEIHEVMLLIPVTKYIFKHSFQLSSGENGLKRFKLFIKVLLTNILAD